MAGNAIITLATIVKVLESTSEVAGRSISGSIQIDEYKQTLDTVAPSTTNKEYALDSMAQYDFISIESDADITVKFNSTADTAIDLKASVVSGTKSIAQMILTATGITDLFITNASTTTSAHVKIIFGSYPA